MKEKTLGKDQQIELFDRFCEELRNGYSNQDLINRDCYFSDLLAMAPNVGKNIKSDFPWYNSIFTPKSEVIALELQVERLKRELDEAKQFDVRVLTQRAKCYREKIEHRKMTNQQDEEQLTVIETLLRGETTAVS